MTAGDAPFSRAPGRRWGASGLPILAALLTWTLVLCAILIVVGPRGTLVGGVLDVRTLALVSALAVTLTLGLAPPRIPSAVGYLVAHLAGAVLLLGVLRGIGLLAITFPHASFPWGWPQVTLPLDAFVTREGGAPTPASLVVIALGLTWELSYAATWLVVRERRVWLAFALIVATPVLTAHPRGRDTLFIALSLGGLILAAVTAARAQRRATFPGGSPLKLPPRVVELSTGLRLALALLVPLAGGLSAAAWALPAPAVQVRTPRPAYLGATLRRLWARVDPAGRTGDTTGLTSFGGELPVGGAFRPDGSPVLTARVADPSRSPYWRGAVYDRYAGGTWQALPTHTVAVAPGAPLPAQAGVVASPPITEDVTLIQPSTTLFTAGPPLQVSISTTVDMAGATPAPAAEIVSIGPSGGRALGTYEAVSAAAPSAPLSPAPVLPPAERALDLALPPALPARVRALSRRLMSYSADPYTQAWDIQLYLRRGYTYDTSPPAAPPGEDPVDYFLFRSRSGFCTHFATAMVVLARAGGIPARLVTGYAAGHLEGGHFLVTTADAHAWPELWIAGRGWLTFEPTPNFSTPFQTGPAPIRSSANPSYTPSAGSSPAPSPASSASPRATGTARATATKAAPTTTPSPSGVGGGGQGSAHGGGQGGGGGWRPPALPAVLRHIQLPAAWRAPVAGGLAAIVAILGLVAVTLQRRTPDAATLYRRMSRLAAKLGAGPRGGQTALEWAASLAARRPEDGSIALTVAALYSRQRYGGAAPAREELLLARASWRALRRRWRRRLLTRRPLT